jgi:hypothetical protein
MLALYKESYMNIGIVHWSNTNTFKENKIVGLDTWNILSH